jgi:DNA-directed RNA polymerase specialized sigma24 family protein
MNGDRRTARDTDPTPAGPAHPAGAQGRPTVVTPVSDDSRIAIEVRGLVEQGQLDEARERFTELVAFHQRRASRIAYQYLRDVAEADEAVQDAFVKVFSRIESYREAWPFEVWFTRILINGCLDRRKAWSRRNRWFVGGGVTSAQEARASTARNASDPENVALGR